MATSLSRISRVWDHRWFDAAAAGDWSVASPGRLTPGVGIGWSAEEFAALGIPFAGRGRRTAEYVAAMRTLWADDVASFSGEFPQFESVLVNSKPVRARHPDRDRRK